MGSIVGRFLLLLLLLAGARDLWAAEPQAVPRTVLALYDSREEQRIRLSRIHTMAEMPLNHLGLTVSYWDVAKGLPSLDAQPDLRGVLAWFAGNPFDDPVAYDAWIAAAMGRGLRVAVLGQTGMRASRGGDPMPHMLVDRFYRRFGLKDLGEFSELTYRTHIDHSDPGMVGFERELTGVLPGHPLLTRVDDRVTAHLTVRQDDEPTARYSLIVTGPSGGLAVENYSHHFDPEFNRKLWLIDPFAFFRAAFATDDLPKPDVTTVSGRRMYFSHVDGDGWRNPSEVPAYARKRTIAAAVVMKEVVEPYPDLPVTIAPIVADIDPLWKGTADALETARQLFALPQVEPASHTWTHPFFWGFFKDYTRDKEAPFLGGGPVSMQTSGALRRLWPGTGGESYDVAGEGMGTATGIGRYAVPRAFLQEPFDLTQEIGEALRHLSALAPKGKTAQLIQWSGDTTPYEEVIAETRRAGARNINGGDTRMDAEYPSYTSVAPIGVPVGAERQIYSAGSNENTYTDLWTDRFFGFRNLVHTARNTESPRRVKPFNVYYHMYSGQKLASLNALKTNLAEARAREIAPVIASAYAAIADGFYSTRLLADGERRWRVRDRGALNTLRFDGAAFLGVDFARSAGVIGQRHHQGSLYVALDPATAEPVVALMEVDRADVDPSAPRPYLVHGRWVMAGLEVEAAGFRVAAQGFGAGAMVWRVPDPGRYAVLAVRDGVEVWRGAAEADASGRLSFTVEARAETPLELSVRRLGD